MACPWLLERDDVITVSTSRARVNAWSNREERDLDVYDAVTADEVFLTSTSLCICGVRALNGARIADGAVPGPITKRLTEAYVKSVGCDFVQQYLSRLS